MTTKTASLTQCAECGADDARIPAYRTRSGDYSDVPKFCSPSCFSTATRRQAAERVRCAECSKSFSKHFDEAGEPERFCSKRCAQMRAKSVARGLSLIRSGGKALGRTSEELHRDHSDLVMLARELPRSSDTRPILEELSRMQTTVRARFIEAGVSERREAMNSFEQRRLNADHEADKRQRAKERAALDAALGKYAKGDDE